VALTAAAGVLLTATGTAGALVYASWAGLDRLSALVAEQRPQGVGREPVGVVP
jgi:hypothetical protein